MNPLIQDGLNLLVLGMGAVFIFLGLLVTVTTVMSRLVMRWVHDPAAPVAQPTVAVPGSASSPNSDKQLLAVITAALHQHRSRHK